ncbi:hypothetical protein Mkiyose1088_54630 [Mycobacterium kiyosense]|nr:hypothetical protein IWGMT90018_26600 [Mycobacterium kiyosense]BDE14514.1 hypothetical protein MKCMC460_33740 [Mycobacterium sp. 20KCMC460]GLB91197.1 hypothetical protein SRL2020130_40140 [Mycobacterium kiyosense]GLC02214.1 hypothetical protein SRL2020400_28050 [Mycobacterium kiyosense]GLC09580.1 hypothetical protein SRL2020411_42260 [Mycobacterium kiyosense]
MVVGDDDGDTLGNPGHRPPHILYTPTRLPPIDIDVGYRECNAVGSRSLPAGPLDPQVLNGRSPRAAGPC